MGADGSVQRGYIKAANGSLYYGDSETGMLKKSSWVETEEKRYYANERAELYKNQIITFGNTWYCMGQDGSVQKGIVEINEKLYNVDETSGKVIRKAQWVEKSGKRYYTNSDGVLYRNQVITFGSTWYCMGKDGSVQKGIVEVNGKLYYTDETTGQVIKKAQWIEQNGKRKGTVDRTKWETLFCDSRRKVVSESDYYLWKYVVLYGRGWKCSKGDSKQ